MNFSESNRLIRSKNLASIAEKWDGIYQKAGDSVPADVLLENHFLLPEKGYALDLACGLGANALFLAEQGLETSAWDISIVALERLQKTAERKKLKISAKQINIEAKILPKNTFDVIVLSRFLDRSLCNAIMESLREDGLLFYQTYVRDKKDSVGPKNPDYLLARNELINLFQPLKIVLYKENSLIGNLAYGERNEALYIGQKC